MRFTNIFIGNDGMNSKTTIQKVKVIEGTFCKTFVVDQNNTPRTPLKAKIRNKTLYKTASTSNLQLTRKHTNITCLSRNVREGLSRELSAAITSREFSSSPKKKIRTSSIGCAVNVLHIQNKFGLKLPKVKESKITRYFNYNDFYY
jgi:hypothetical protein